MIARELEHDCPRCKGKGKFSPKGHLVPNLCSCPAGRALASSAPVRVFFWPPGVIASAVETPESMVIVHG